ncbi:ATP-binding protein [Streptomyces tritici]|uniref:ATP-binding protein n=1 Tax=Streptomyces tritici TaxID=2054410 RepID=UPI003AEF54F0
MGLQPSAVHHGELALDGPGDARAFSAWIGWIRQTLTEWHLAAHDTDAVLVAAELLSNAARHAGGILRLSLDHRDGVLRIAVTDPSPDPPRPRAHRAEATGGHGLFIVDNLALDWGTRPEPHGKTVWAELPVPG